MVRVVPYSSSSSSSVSAAVVVAGVQLLAAVLAVVVACQNHYTSCCAFAAASASSSSSSSLSPDTSGANSIRRVVIIGGTHGNEYTGIWCVKSLERRRQVLKETYPSLDVSTLIGNPVAFLQNKRFVHSDLNREFSKERLLGRRDDKGDNEEANLGVEQIRAKEIDESLGPKFGNTQADLVVDLHTTTCNMGITIIVPEGDAVMAQAAAYVVAECSNDQNDDDDNNDGSTSNNNNSNKIQCLMHSIPHRERRPNLSSVARHGFTIEVGPVPQGVLRHDAIQKMQRALQCLLQFVHERNTIGSDAALRKLKTRSCYQSGLVPCYRSAPAVQPGEMSGKIRWPCDDENPNFPQWIVHESVQDRDFYVIAKGDPLFVDLDGNIIEYNGSHGDEVHLIFVNEGGYYYESSGTGIGVAVTSKFDLETGMIVELDENEEYDDTFE